MVVKVGINGFGRIGRVIFRTCHENPELEVAAINDPAIDIEYICYLIKFDSTHGKFKGNIKHAQHEIIVDGARIRIFHDKLPSNVPWQSADVQYVVEASGIFTSLQKASGHLANESVKRVIVTAPSVDIPMVILGVNHEDLNIDTRVISSASSTLYCLAPIVKILNDNFGVSEGFITSIHAMTPSLKPLDGLCLRGKHWRDHRSIHQNIIPAATGACKALGKIIPQVKDKLMGVAFRVPIVNVSVLDLTMRLNKETSLEEIAKCIDVFSKTTMNNIIKISNEDAVSSDFIGDQHSCILDIGSSLQLKRDFLKLVCWYENEYSYACRVIDLILFSERQFLQADPRTKMTFVRTRSIKKTTLKNDEHDDDIKNDVFEYRRGLDTSQVAQSKSQIGLRIKSPVRTVRKPTSAHSGGSKEILKNSEIFRIWNDDSENKKRVNNCNSRGSAETTSQTQINNIRAQQRLENVKQEFSKMVSITENLLRKCSKIRDINHPEKCSEEPKKTENSGIDIGKSFESKIAEESSSAKKIYPLSDISMDIVSNIDDRSSSKNYIRDIISNETCSGYNISINLDSCDTLNPTAVCNNDDSSKHLNDEMQTHCMTTKLADDIFQKQVVKTVTNLIDGLTESIVDKSKATDSKVKEHEESKQSIRDSSFENDDDSGFVSPIKRRMIQVGKSYDVSKPKYIEGKSHVEVNYMEINGNNKILGHNSQTTKSLVGATDDQMLKDNIHTFKTFKLDRFSAKPIDNAKTNIEIPPEILNNLNKLLTDPIIIVSEHSKCASSTLTASGNSDNGRKMDLYDKLDSVSASDSDNSFQIHERKSQVINISDLTNSIEDLVRLDKICRIIEISDELSDNLFSSLGNPDSGAIRKAKWSFKDLCQRIKLDEFCNKLFAVQNQPCHCEKK